jgi:hypothetical protein
MKLHQSQDVKLYRIFISPKTENIQQLPGISYRASLGRFQESTASFPCLL